MNRTLGNRHMQLARRTLHASIISVGVLTDSLKETWESRNSRRTKENLDFTSAISGDDLARLRVGEDRIVKPIGEQRGIWSDARHHTGRWAA